MQVQPLELTNSDEFCEDREFSQQLSEETDSGCESDGKMDSKSKHGKKRKGYSKEITKVLNDWFFANLQNPYPSEEEKKDMVNLTTLSLLQINNWFSNKRVRYKRKMQKEGQEVIDGGVDINQAFRSIKKQNKGEKKETSPNPKRKRSSASKDSSSYTKKKRPTPLVKPENEMNTKTATPSPALSSTPITTSPEPKNVLNSLLESPSNKNMHGTSVALLRSPIITHTSPLAQQLEEKSKVPDEKSNDDSNASPKRIDFFQSLQQAGVVFPQSTPTVIPVIPSYPQYIVHHNTPYHVDPYHYSYPIYTNPQYYAPYIMAKQEDTVSEEQTYFELETGLDETNNTESSYATENFATDFFTQDNDDGIFFENAQATWNPTPETPDELIYF